MQLIKRLLQRKREGSDRSSVVVQHPNFWMYQ